MVAVRLVVAFVSWVVDKGNIQCVRSPNGNPIHSMGLMFGSSDVAVLGVVEVTK